MTAGWPEGILTSPYRVPLHHSQARLACPGSDPVLPRSVVKHHVSLQLEGLAWATLWGFEFPLPLTYQPLGN